jgi:hypothetical protein
MVSLVQSKTDSGSFDAEDRNAATRIVLKLVAKCLPVFLRSTSIDPDVIGLGKRRRHEQVVRDQRADLATNFEYAAGIGAKPVNHFLVVSKNDNLGALGV